MAIKTKDFMNFKAETVSEDGFFSGYCNVFDVEDSYGDVVRKGAFIDSLNEWQAKGKLPPILWQHDKATVLGVWTKLYEDDKGLYGEGQLLINDVAKAKEAHALLKHGAIDGLSIGYYVKEYSIDNEQGVYNLLKLDLREISIVTFPANTDSRIDAVKSHLAKGELPSLSDFEKFLREAGFSKSQATAIAGHGLRSLLQGEPDSKISSEKSSGDTAQILAILNSI